MNAKLEQTDAADSLLLVRRLRGQRLLPLLLIFAMCVLQALGAVRAYACDCTEAVRLVQDSRCGGACHPGGNHHDHAERGHRHEAAPDGSHEHDEVRGSVDAAGTLKAPSSELAAPAGVAVLPPGLRPYFEPAPQVLPFGFDSGPPPPRLVARTVVRQV